MASGKLSPRQKMINMMYLVLTALLALNVSKEIIHAFVTMSNSLEVSNKSTDMRNDLAFKAFDKQMQTDEAKTKPHYDRAKKAKQLSDALLKDIDNLKAHIIRKTEKLADTAAVPKLEDIRKQDDFDTPTRILCGKGETGQVSEEGKDSEAKILRAKLNKYKAEMVANLDPKDQPEFKKRFDEIFKLEDPSKEEIAKDKKKTWEMITFYHNPVVASCAILTKFQTDIKNSESEVLNKLLANIDASTFKVTDFEAKVVAPTSYVLVGQQYKADVFLAAFNKTETPDVLVGGGKLPYENGMAKFSAGASAEGLKKWGGVIKVKDPVDPTKFKDYEFNAEYIVAKPAAVISPTKMNVFYIGVDNPVSISVPGVANEKVKVSVVGGGVTLTKAPGGSGEQWIAKATTQGEATVTINADFDGKSMTMGAQKFRVKQVPNPVATIADKKSGTMSRAIVVAQGSIIPKMENFDFELFFRITKFKMTLARRSSPDPIEIETTGNQMTEKMKSSISAARAGDKVYFEYIDAVGPDGKTRRLEPLNIVLQ
ncbi:MAG: gliding motility protein GldM [Bacteroidia bacterium]